jgi:hypothetical protein
MPPASPASPAAPARGADTIDDWAYQRQINDPGFRARQTSGFSAEDLAEANRLHEANLLAAQQRAVAAGGGGVPEWARWADRHTPELAIAGLGLGGLGLGMGGGSMVG